MFSRTRLIGTIRLFTLSALLFAFSSAMADDDLATAKAEGLVGEANTGYLAPVRSPASAEVRTLVAEVNAKREVLFKSTAAKTDATLDQVRLRFYQLAVEKTQAGNYYQDTNGRWRQK